MTLPSYALCPWPVDTSLCSVWSDLEKPVQDRAVALATATLSRLTGYRINNCPVTVRPCRANVARQYPMQPFVWGVPGVQPAWWASDAIFWVDFGCGMEPDGCSCTELCRVDLGGPVASVEAVKLNGVTVDPADYVLSGQTLIWAASGDCGWPTCQDITLPDTEDGTFSVSFIPGSAPDLLAAQACGALACEFATFIKTGKCRLPTGVTQLIRQGVTYNLPTGAFPDGLTGLREVDAFIMLWNPNHLMEPSRVWSPDL